MIPLKNLIYIYFFACPEQVDLQKQQQQKIQYTE